jgi:hypothetical protein
MTRPVCYPHTPPADALANHSSPSPTNTELSCLAVEAVAMGDSTLPPVRQSRAAEEVVAPVGADPFDPRRLRIDPAVGDHLGVKKALLNVPVRKPNRQEFFRVRTGTNFRLAIAAIELKDEREFYAVLPGIAAAILGETKPVEIRLCISRTGGVFLWPVPLPAADGRVNPWHRAAREAAELAENNWVRMAANMGAGTYDVFVAPEGLADPEWPEQDFAGLLKLAFGNGRLIETVDHPVIKRLRGQ